VSDLRISPRVLGLAFALLACWPAGKAVARDGDGAGLVPVSRLHDGLPLDVLVEGSTAYVALDTGIAIHDVDDASRPRLVGGLRLTSPARGLALSGSLLLVANGQSGLTLIDVSDPASPLLLSSLGASNVQDVAVVGSLAYLAEAHEGPPSIHGLRIVDVSNPGSPSEVSFTTMGNGALSVAVSGGLATIGLGADLGLPRGLVLVDVSVPASPTVRGFLDIGKPVHDLVVDGSIAHLAVGFPLDGDVVSVDLSDPAAPLRLGSLRLPDVARGIALVGNTAHVAAGTSGLVTIDLSDPSAPQRLDALPTGREAWTVAARGDASFIGERSSRGQGGFTTIATPGFPSRLAELASEPFAEAVDVVAIGGTVYALRREGLSLHDTTNPAAPVRLGEWTEPALNLSALAVADGLAAAAQGDTVRLIDVDDAFAPAQVGLVSLARGIAIDLELDGNRLLVATGRGLEVFDVSLPATPTPLGVHDAGAWASGVSVNEDWAQLVAGDRLQILDLDAAGSPALIGELALGDSLTAVAARSDLAVATGLTATLHVIDISDPAAPSLVATLPGPAGFDVVLRGDQALVAIGESGVQLIDLSDPANPTVVAFHDTSGVASAVALDGPTVHVATMSAQHWVLSCTSCIAPCLVVADVQPASVAVCAGSEVTLDGSASLITNCGSGGAVYQWYEGGVPIAGETNDGLVIPDTHAAGVFDFRLDVGCSTDPSCTDSATASVTLLEDRFPTIDRDSLRVRKIDATSDLLSWSIAAGTGETNVHRTVVPGELSVGSVTPATLAGTSPADEWVNDRTQTGGVLFLRVFPRGDCTGESLPFP